VSSNSRSIAPVLVANIGSFCKLKTIGLDQRVLKFEVKLIVGLSPLLIKRNANISSLISFDRIFSVGYRDQACLVFILGDVRK